MRPERFPPYFILAMMLFCLIILILLFEGLDNRKEGNNPPAIDRGGIPHIVYSARELSL